MLAPEGSIPRLCPVLLALGSGCTSAGEVAFTWSLSDVPAGLARELHVDADTPVQVSVRVDDGERVRTVRFPELATTHVLPVLELRADTAHDLVIEVRDARGRTGRARAEVRTEPLPDWFPALEVLAWDPEAMEPGLTLVTLKAASSGRAPVVVLDADLRVTWWLEPTPSFGDLRQTPSGTLLGMAAGGMVEVDALGRTVRQLLREELDPPGALHHELFLNPDATLLSLRERSTTVPAYPVDLADPDGELAEAVIRDHEVLLLDPTGVVLASHLVSDALDTSRVGFDSDVRTEVGLDWCHANAVVADPADGGRIVGLRHQDAVVKLDADGALVWILGDPAGWREPWASRRLQPIGAVEWPYHQHAPELSEGGLLALFDNHNHGTTPYGEPLEDPVTSRAMGYLIDEAAGTVTQAFVLEQTATGLLYSGANGDADVQPETGNVLVDFGFVTRVDGVPTEDLGYGNRLVRLVEWDPARPSEPVLDLQIHGDGEVEPLGWQAWRAERIRTLYPPSVGIEEAL